MTQQLLDAEHLRPFYTNTATADQVRNFLALRPMMDLREGAVIVDVGGGHGFFASALQDGLDGVVRVIDMDPVSVTACTSNTIPATLGDALEPPIAGDEDVACFNLILHHLVGRSETSTARMQLQALEAWRGRVRFLFVSEYCYGPRIGARLIYWVTRSKPLSAIAGFLGRYATSLQANTLGVGVRYRSHDEWLEFFHRAGFATVAAIKGREEKVSWPRRVFLLLTSIRRDTFLLAAK